MLEDIQTAFLAAVEAGDPTKLVKAKVRTGALDDWFGDRNDPRPIHVIALGKAAPRMVWGLLEANVPFTGLGVTTPEQRKPSLERFWRVGGHPVPTDASFDAGEAVFEAIAAWPEDARVLVLLSGGASSCVDMVDDRAAAVRLHNELLGSGLPIDEVNRRRAQGSHFKAGGLGRALAPRQVRVWTLCDVPPQHHRLIGSGPCDVPDIEHTVLADAGLAAQGAAHVLRALGHDVEVLPRIEGDMESALHGFLDGLAPGKVRVAAGEATVQVPENAPPGGRCAHAALAAAGVLSAGIFLAGATDGVDGTTRDAAAWAGPADADPEALAARRAHGVLAAKGQTLRTGATGTNLNDVWIAARPNP